MPRKSGSKLTKGRSRKSTSHFEFRDEPMYKTEGWGIPQISKLKYKNESQKNAVETIRENVLTFISGPAGTAKTFLAVAELIQGLKDETFKKGIISRPTVEAGEGIGYLPGDIDSKLDPYVRPIYDCIDYFVGSDTRKRLIEDEIIEIVPFQYMRGRTFTDSFIILDETQNATPIQLKLALTRIGFGSKCVATFDEGQIDLPEDKSCIDDLYLFEKRNGIGFFEFQKKDIVRAPIVSQVLTIYEEKE